MHAISLGYEDPTSYTTVTITTRDKERSFTAIGQHSGTQHPPGSIVIAGTKRVLGRTNKDGKLADDIKKYKLPYELDDAGLPFIPFNGEKVTPIEITALLILRCVREAEELIGERPTSCVLTVPAYFTVASRQATRDAAQIAGLKVTQIISEPLAAGIATLLDCKKEQDGKYLVVDIGGGTLDCSKFSMTTMDQRKAFMVEATSGDHGIGGDEFSRLLEEAFKKKYPEDLGNTSGNELLNQCEVSKKQRDDEIYLRYGEKQYVLSRDEYKQALEELLIKSEKVIDESLEGDGKKDIKGVILTGGSAKLEIFTSTVEDKLKGFQFEARKHLPSHVVARGAAIMTRTINGPVINEVVPQSLGVEVQDPDTGEQNIMNFQLRRNRALPASQVMEYKGVNDKVTQVKTYQGESANTEENTYIGMWEFPVNRNEKFWIKFELDSDGILNVTWTKTSQGPWEAGLNVDMAGSRLEENERNAMSETANLRYHSVFPPKNKGRGKRPAITTSGGTTKKRKTRNGR